MINLINRNDESRYWISTHYNKMRFFIIEFIIKEFEKLNKIIKTIRIK